MVDHKALVDEVRRFLNDRRQSYIEFLTIIEGKLAAFRDQPAHRALIYRIYSRRDKQLGSDPLKTDWKIARKLGKWREQKLDTRPQDIHDIVGVTLVTYFGSQVELVADELSKSEADGGLEAFDRDEKNEDGYHAVHLKLRRKDLMFHGMLCEVQVKTLLHDGWATKTHDLTYKPQGKIPPDLVRQMDLIGDALQLFERQSDILRGLIEREWVREKNHRQRAQRELLTALTQDATAPVDPDFVKISNSIRTDSAILATCNDSDARLRAYFDSWGALVAKHGHGRQTCRLITLLASIRESRDLDHIAFDAIDSWIAATGDAFKLTAMHFRALAAYSLNDVGQAISQARTVLQSAIANALPADAFRMNLAYYLAESQFRNTNEDSELAKKEAEDLITLVAAAGIPATKRNSFLDTKGFVQIAFGESEEEVRDGLACCRAALDATPLDDPYRQRLEAYYQLHERRAWKRLSEEWS